VYQLSDLKADLFKALAHPVRIEILNTLRNHQEVSVNDLKDHLGLEAANVSQQLAVLRNKKLVKTRKEANNVYYSIQDETIFGLLDVAKVFFNNQFSDMKQFLGDAAQLFLPFITITLMEALSPLYLTMETGLMEVELLLC
jgi:DNA-binding transcriptional ArsR family regulator